MKKMCFNSKCHPCLKITPESPYDFSPVFPFVSAVFQPHDSLTKDPSPYIKPHTQQHKSYFYGRPMTTTQPLGHSKEQAFQAQKKWCLFFVRLFVRHIEKQTPISVVLWRQNGLKGGQFSIASVKNRAKYLVTISMFAWL